MEKLKNRWNELSKPGKLILVAFVVIVLLVAANYIV